MTRASQSTPPRLLLVPGRDGFAAWQVAAAALRPDSLLVEMRATAGEPRRNPWLGRIDRAIGAPAAPVVIAAHGLGSLAVAWWGGLLGRRAARLVAGALLVAPPRAAPALGDFAPLPAAMLPFPAIVASGDGDPDHARACAAEWVSDCCEAGLDRLGDLIDLLVQGGPGLSRYAYRPEPPARRATRPPRPDRRPAAPRL